MSGELDVSLLQHLERVEQFLLEHVLAASVVALGRQHGDGVLRQLVAAESGLAAPDRQQDIARNAVLLLDRRKRAAVLGREFLRLLGEPGDTGLADVIGGRLHELGLSARRRAGPSGQIKVGQRQIGLDPADRHIESPA